MNADEIANKIYDALDKQSFNMWYTYGAFKDHLMGFRNCLNRDQIIEDIKRIFNLTPKD